MRASRHLRAVLAAGCLFTATAPARGDDLTGDPAVAPVDAAGKPLAAPAVSSPLVWRTEHGWWFTDRQVIKLNARIDWLEKEAARQCVDAQIEAAKGSGRLWQIGLGILTGAAIGYCAASSNHCGIGK